MESWKKGISMFELLLERGAVKQGEKGQVDCSHGISNDGDSNSKTRKWN